MPAYFGTAFVAIKYCTRVPSSSSFVFLICFFLSWERSWVIWTFCFIGLGCVDFSSIESQFAEQGGHISGDLCIEGWQNQARPCSSPCRSKLFCFMSASNKLLHLLSHHQGTNSDNIHFYKPSTNHPRILGSLLA